MSNYFRIYFGEDSVSIESLSKDEVLELLNDGDEDMFSEKIVNDLNNKEEVSWPEYCECYKSIIIKGCIVKPEKVEVVIKYKID